MPIRMKLQKQRMFKLYAPGCMRTWQIAGLDRGLFEAVLLPVTSDDGRSTCEKEAVEAIASVKPLAGIA